MTFVAGADLQFAGFSNPHLWDPSRLLQGELLERARALPERERWSLVEDLDPEISHFEFFLSKGPVQRCHWQDDAELLAACGQPNRCLWGWPGTELLGPDLMPLSIEAEDLRLMQAFEGEPSRPLALLPLEMGADERCLRARRLLALGVLELVA